MAIKRASGIWNEPRVQRDLWWKVISIFLWSIRGVRDGSTPAMISRQSWSVHPSCKTSRATWRSRQQHLLIDYRQVFVDFRIWLLKTTQTGHRIVYRTQYAKEWRLLIKRDKKFWTVPFCYCSTGSNASPRWKPPHQIFRPRRESNQNRNLGERFRFKYNSIIAS